MIFDQPRAELPIATLHTRDSSTQLSIDVRNWFGARWRWFRPRTIPLLVAFAGMLVVLGASSYLRNFEPDPPEQQSAQALQVQIASNEPTTTASRPGILHVETAPAAAVTSVTEQRRSRARILQIESWPPGMVTVLTNSGKPITITPGVYRVQLTSAQARAANP